MNYALLNEWAKAKEVLANATKTESELREQIIAEFFPDHKSEGTENVELQGGYKLSTVFGVSYDFIKDKDALETAKIALAKTGEDGEVALGSLIVIKEELSVKAYKALTPSQHKIIDPVVVSKPSKPQVKLVAPKEGK